MLDKYEYKKKQRRVEPLTSMAFPNCLGPNKPVFPKLLQWAKNWINWKFSSTFLPRSHLLKSWCRKIVSFFMPPLPQNISFRLSFQNIKERRRPNKKYDRRSQRNDKRTESGKRKPQLLFVLHFNDNSANVVHFVVDVMMQLLFGKTSFEIVGWQSKWECYQRWM